MSTTTDNEIYDFVDDLVALREHHDLDAITHERYSQEYRRAHDVEV